ncbi:hypothetical protein [Prochlorococcus marinus]|uniref:Uncharacterized protein n=1 Tax=Prochlorococcus marinus XMU1408 TaxID=2213228 RepID=A0A318R4Z4_PROMR|nr:hypothetical protein [Prochlorococcus marinus]MBW3041566.1 hypothetical protein [Prochlorococcus marinus str. XMU1408]PYE02722.1 hypothetical protein DNJ73_02930 [Prochlorococcus marinus XMU1408]
MGQPQRIDESYRIKRSKKIRKRNPSGIEKIDAFTQVAEFQKEEVRRELFYSYLALILKSGLLIVFSTSLVNLGLASHQRVNRNIELSYLLEKESKKLHRLRRRFDEMFVIGGEKSFFKEQDQWITPNSVRVIWR